MNRILPIIIFALLCTLKMSAQAPDLPKKDALSQTLLSSRTFSDPAQPDTVQIQHNLPSAYTLEVVGKVNAATGRGLDLDARNAALNGFRLSLDASNLKWTAPLTSSAALTASPAGQNYVIRVAVKNDSAHIYQNGAYILSQPLSVIGDIVGGVETSDLSSYAGGPSLIPNWAGTAPNNTGKPTDYGWAGYSGTTPVTIFNTANAGSGIRYMDVSASSGSNLHTYNGSTYTGRLLYIRWDNNSITNAVYTYPVTLEANTIYDFSMLHAYISNATGSKTITVGVGPDTTVAGRIASHTFVTSGTKALKREDFSFTSHAAGVYYITITGNWALFSIGELAINKINVQPRFIFGKNYSDGTVDLQISSVTYEDGAYAPASIITGSVQNVAVSGTSASYLPTFNTSFMVAGKTDLHLTGDNSPLINSTVALNSNDARLIFDNVRPSVVISNWLDKVTINGISAKNNPAVRTAIYKNGTIVIPNGNLTSLHALEVYTQPNLSGDSTSYAIDVYHDTLGVFDNRIRSFRLHRGYMATLANNSDGSGYSRVFIANDSDLVVNTMPAGLDTTVSFIRVFKWDWVSKKGKAGWDPGKINATWYYDWNIGGSSSDDYNYVGIRQNAGWPAWTDINNKKGINHLLGFNEPDHTDQSNMTQDQCIAEWPEMMKSGYRIGSPAPSDPYNGWLPIFLKKADSLNYRVDFVAIHCYWGGFTPQQWYDRLLYVYNNIAGKHPLWITEWNNGANWTSESWPSDTTQAFQKQLNDLKGILQVLDTASFIERYAEYDWVQYQRSLVLGDTLTPAGKYYYANKSDFAYNPKMAYVHNWQLAAPWIDSAINKDDYTKVTLSFRDINGELGSKYVLERLISNRDTGFVAVKTFTGYPIDSTLSFVDSIYNKATYRVKAYSLDSTTYAYGRSLDISMDAATVAPTSLTGIVLSSSQDSIKWNAAANARSYNIKRSLSANGPFTTIAPKVTMLQYQDTALSPATTYYYVVTSLNTAGESSASPVLQLTTKALVAPVSVLNPHVASGDTKAILTWNFQYDAKYDLYRSQTANGVYDTIATNVNAVRYEDTGKQNDNTYYYKIVAQNAAGRSPETSVLSATPRSGHQLYISFNESTGTFAEDSWGGYHGTFDSTVNHVAGHTNGAIQCSGSSTSYVSLQSGPVASLHDFSIAAWIKMDALSNWMRIFDFGTGTDNYMFLTPQANVAGGKSTVRLGIKNGSGEQQLDYAFTWPLNTWTHLAITRSGNTANMYINGNLVATNPALTINPSDLGITNLNYIGKSQFNDPLLKGTVDEFKIYNRALSDSEVVDAMKLEQFISFDTIPSKQVGDADFNTGATSSSGLADSISSSNQAVATIVNGAIHIVGAGETIITASQPGNDIYAPAKSVARKLTVYKMYYVDADGDGFGSQQGKLFATAITPPGYATNNTDCNDSKILYADNDHDGLGAGAPAACGVANNSDCDDTNPFSWLFKVMVCHNGNSICVALASLPAHLLHGDQLGSCAAQCTARSATATNDLKIANPGELSKVNLFPNPVTDNLNVQLSGFVGPITLKVYNATGILLLSQRMIGNAAIISFKGLSAGVYFLQIDNGAKIIGEKIIKQ